MFIRHRIFKGVFISPPYENVKQELMCNLWEGINISSPGQEWIKNKKILMFSHLRFSKCKKYDGKTNCLVFYNITITNLVGKKNNFHAGRHIFIEFASFL